MKSKIIILFTLLFIMGQLAVLFFVYHGTRTYMVSQAEEKLVHASDVFQRRMSRRIDYLRIEANLLGSSYALKNAVMSHNNKKLNNIALNMGYDRIVLMQQDGKILVDLFKNNLAGNNSFPFNDFRKNKVSLNKQSATIVVVKNHVYEFVIVPLTISMSDGVKQKLWLGIGSEVIDDTLAEMKERYTLKLDILVRIQDEDKKWRSLASSLKFSKKTELSVLSLNQIKQIDTQITSAQMAYINDVKYIILPVKFITPGKGDNFQVLLMYKFSQVMSGVNSLMKLLFIIFMIGLILTIICAWLLARKIAKPISTLSDAVSRVIEGDYRIDILVKGKDEISLLSRAFYKMISTIKQREKTIIHQLTHDLNTNLPNRFNFKQKFAGILNGKNSLDISQQNVSLLFIGVDRIAEINNTLGHEFGLLLVKQVSERLKSVKNIDYLAHISSTEFVLLVKYYDTYEKLKQLTKSILGLLETPFKIDKASVDVNTYIGVYRIDKNIKNPSVWLRHADQAYYVAKMEGKRYCFYTQEMDQRSTYRLSLMGELIKAIDNDSLEVFYQPKVDLSNSNNIQAEALIRWNHPKFGFLSPEEFIHLAEQTGHIQKLTKWVISQVILQLKELTKTHNNIKIAVNISAKDLSSSKILSFIVAQLKQHNIQANRLALEITESAVMKNIHQALKTLLSFRDLGVIIAIDDFGTGYSSMEYLTKLPIHEIKIDQSFIKNMHKNNQDALIVRSLINLAHNLGLTIVGEGVECEEVKNMLSKYGCDFAQGYYFSKALSAEHFKIWLKKQIN